MSTAPRKGRRAEGRLNKFVQPNPPAAGKLPFVHMTRAYAFDEMLDENALQPTHCEVFDESLIYLFYGRPAYRAKDGRNARLEFEWPIVFVFDPDKIPQLKRVFPFDTGAFKLKLYEEFFDKRAKIEDFEIETSLEGIRKLVGTFYLDHKEYFKNVPLGRRQFEAQGIYEMSRLPGVQGGRSTHGTRDERSSAIEVQVSEPINFVGSLLAVVLPEPYLDDPEIRDALARWHVTAIETYSTLHNLSSDAWVGQIYHIVRKLYERLGYLK
jgi:hypothetical protein